MLRLILALSAVWCTGLALAQDRPFRDFREHAAPMPGPGANATSPRM